MTTAPGKRTRAKTVVRTPSAAPRGGAARPPDLHRFPIVGISASAGGLDAFRKLLAAMPGDGGMALVLVPHLDPTHASLMVELLARQTTMPVVEARQGMTVEPNHVYVIPPNADLAIHERVLQVTSPVRGGAYTAIDAFLQSLAADQQEYAVGVVLSGTGSHGALGARAIKVAGGLVLAQAPESAEHDQMPRSAIATGVADHILPPQEMPPVLVRHAAALPVAGSESLAPEDVSPVLELLRTHLRRDCRGYRVPMLHRRIRRRMALCRIERVAGYVEHLRTHPDELQALAKDLSISVTAFFREPEAFQVLERIVIPDLVQRAGRDGGNQRQVRVWVPGCATGEEAYCIAILFLEHFAAVRQPVNLQVFATDIDNDALDDARLGVYPDSIGSDVSAARLRQFFVKTDRHHYQVSKALRQVITFAPQNLIGDAPFSRLDLVACRNVLIYLEPGVQASLLALFHFAVNDGGYLFLGPAESVGVATDRFEPISKKWRVYRRIGAGRRDLVEIPIRSAGAARRGVARRDERLLPPARAAVLHRALLANFAPAAVLVNQRYEILSVQGPVVAYLEFPPGELTRDLLAMARPGLRAAIRAACQAAIRLRPAAGEAKARVKRDGAYASCVVTAKAVTDASDAGDTLVVTFRDDAALPADAPTTSPRRHAPARAAEPAVVTQLENELRVAQVANQDLKAAHEELMSINEALHSANEEMETSKEEFQSLNEELNTVNSQLQEKVHELDAAHSDMMNLLASTEIASVFLDTELRIRRFTPPTVKVLNLLPTDIGRPFSDISLRAADADLLSDCRRVLEHLAPEETVVRTADSQAYLRRVLPYHTSDFRIDGVAIAWVNITRRLAAEAEARHFSAVLRDSNDAVAAIDLEGRITNWNRGAERLYGYTVAEATALHLRDLVPEAHQKATVDLLQRLGRGDLISESHDAVRVAKDGRVVDVWATMTLLRDDLGRPDAIVTTERDVTEIKEGVVAKQVAHLYERAIDGLPIGAVLCEDGRLTVNRAAEAITGYVRHELPTVDAWCTRLHGSQAQRLRPVYEARPTPADAKPMSLALLSKDGNTRRVELSVSALDEHRAIWTLVDMTAHDLAERALRTSEDYLQSLVNTAADAIITIDEGGIIELFNPAAERMFGYTTAEATGQNVRVLMPEPYRSEHGSYLAEYRRTGTAHIIGIGREVLGRRKDGTTFPADLAVGEIDHQRRFVGIIRDLSARRALEWRLAESQVHERRNMARELHDGFGGHMTGIGLLAQHLQAQLETAGSPLAARAEQLVASMTNAQQQLRSVIRGLMPVDAVPEGLMRALGDLLAHCEKISNIACRFLCEPPVHVNDPMTALHLFRIAQEAVNNAVRHAQPRQITLSLSATVDRVQIVVADDGRGVGKVQEGHPGIGLDSMRQRAQLLGGQCWIQSVPEQGTTVTCWVPAHPRQEPRPTIHHPPSTS